MRWALPLTLAIVVLTLPTTSHSAPPWVNPEEPEPAPPTDAPELTLTPDQLRKLEDLGVPVIYLNGRPAVKIRLARVNAPEIFHPRDERERELGLRAKRFVEEQVRRAGGWVRCRAYGLGKYRRIIADVYPDDEDVTLAELLVEHGLAEWRRYPKPDPLPDWFPREFRARVARVVDGDTLYVYVRVREHPAGQPAAETHRRTAESPETATETGREVVIGRYRTGVPAATVGVAVLLAGLGLALLTLARRS